MAKDFNIGDRYNLGKMFIWPLFQFPIVFFNQRIEFVPSAPDHAYSYDALEF